MGPNQTFVEARLIMIGGMAGLVILGLAIFLDSGGRETGAEERPISPLERAPSFATLIEDHQPAVVNIRSAETTRGSGFAIDARGYLLTSLHVVDKVDPVLVSLGGKPFLEATVVATDPKNDLAIIKVDSDDAPRPLRIELTHRPRLGDWLVVLGNPFGQGLTVSAGVVGGLPGALSAGNQAELYQTDAAINPGNSGGPVLDTEGRVIGVATARISLGSSVGFFTPIEHGASLLESALQAD